MYFKQFWALSLSLRMGAALPHESSFTFGTVQSTPRVCVCKSTLFYVDMDFHGEFYFDIRCSCFPIWRERHCNT